MRSSSNQLIAGKHYVIASGTSGNSVEGIGYQKPNNRDAVNVKFDNGKLVENDLLWDFVLGGDATNGWTFYDKYTTNEGFLRAPTSNNNYLTLNTTPANYAKWSISIASSSDGYKASIVAKSGNRKNMRYNLSSSLFACYASSTDQSDIYLFVKDDDTDYEIYSASPITGTHSLTTLFVKGKLTVKNNAVITVSGEITNSTAKADSLIIEDGGQLILSDDKSVAATVKKTVNKPTETWGGSDASGWYAISSPVGDIAPGNVTNLVLPAVSTVPQYDLYRYDEDFGWYNAQHSGQSISTLEKGHGYLYARSANASLSYAGTVTSASFDIENLSKSDVKHSGLHLIGNPYTHDIYLGNAITGDLTTTGYYALNASGSWISTANTTPIKPEQAVFVFVTKDKATISFNNATGASKANHDYIQFTVSNSQYEDVAYAMFDNGTGLNKIEHRNSKAPMIYIPQDDNNYAIAMMDDNTQIFGLNFKAATTGRYTLSFDTKGEYNYLHVIDRFTGTDTDMLLEGEYNFIGSPIDNDNRFVVKLAYKPDYSEGNDEIFAFQNGNDIFVSGEGELQVFDVTGRFVMSERINGATSISADALSKGVYVLRIVGSEIKTQKIVVR